MFIKPPNLGAALRSRDENVTVINGALRVLFTNSPSSPVLKNERTHWPVNRHNP